MNQTLPTRRRIIDDAVQGLGSTRGPHMSTRSSMFTLVSGPIKKVLDTRYADIMIVDASDKSNRIYFGRAYDPAAGDDLPPKCFSDNGVGPSTQAMEPQSPTCLLCPHNERGSAVSFRGNPTTACDNRKKLAFIMPDDSPDVTVYEFQIPPASLSNFKSYAAWIGQQKHPTAQRACDVCDFVTRVSFDPERQGVMVFTASAWVEDGDPLLEKMEYIHANALSDLAVGRQDVAFDPERVKALLAGEKREAIAAPAQQAAPRLGQQASVQQLEAPAAEPPKPRIRSKKEGPAANGGTAPFMAPAAATTLPAAAPPQGAGAPPSDMDIPSFLKRTSEAPAPATQAPPRFGIGGAPKPPDQIADAVAQAMNLPSRRG
jgi:hypothetical protein